ncbi:hypothetical protein [Hyphomicrobium sp.]|uniref:hypothetical protein n=1 Tax=Hyphomicrobium sp. TaxID=82 RepID=UPI001DEEDEA2|nr:hypothetical protein [Hyphomicrobium sp.]MBY0560006.1 hypothetical protein [Hyphomicrobium sp.]
MAIKVRSSHFVGTSKVFGREKDALAAILRGLAADNAVIAVRTAIADESLAISGLKFTDNSTGTAGTAVGSPALPKEAIAATGSLGADLAAFNAAISKLTNAMAVITGRANTLRAVVGLPNLVSAGTVATAGTIPAQDKSVAGASGSSAASFVSAKAVLEKVSANLGRLVEGVNDTLVAFGAPAIPTDVEAPISATGVLSPGTAVAAAATGSVALSKADADAFLAKTANDVATIAALWVARVDTLAVAPLKVVAGK